MCQWKTRVSTTYEDRMKSSSADQDTFMECDQMRFIFQHCHPYGLRTSSIVVAVLDPIGQKCQLLQIWRLYMIFISASKQTGRRSIIVGICGRGRLGTSWVSSSAWLCWSSTHLVQCGLDEPNWAWTQIWVQARMPNYSLNWTARSSVIQAWQKCQWYSSPTRRWPNQSREPFDLESTIDIRYASGTNARRPS